jgi:hypothetical protein
MKTMRLTLRDRLWGSAIALSIAYLLVLQALLAGMAQGMMAAASAGPLDIICTSNGIVSHTGEGDLPGGEALRWHCATLCQLASTAAPVVLGAHTGFVYAPSRRVIATCPNPADICQSAFQALIAEARAPPFSI